MDDLDGEVTVMAEVVREKGGCHAADINSAQPLKGIIRMTPEKEVGARD